MKNYFFPRAGGLTAGFAVFLALFLSCATLPPETDSFSPETAAGVPVRPERPVCLFALSVPSRLCISWEKD